MIINVIIYDIAIIIIIIIIIIISIIFNNTHCYFYYHYFDGYYHHTNLAARVPLPARAQAVELSGQAWGPYCTTRVAQKSQYKRSEADIRRSYL